MSDSTQQAYKVLARKYRPETFADLVGQVLNQVAAERHVEHLGATADAEKRQVDVERRPNERVFEGIPILSRGPRFLMRLLAVASRINVGAACNDEPVEGGEDPLRRLRIDYLRREHHDSAARVGHRTNVDLWQKRCPHIPDAGLRLLEIARDADDRPYGLGR